MGGNCTASCELEGPSARFSAEVQRLRLRLRRVFVHASEEGNPANIKVRLTRCRVPRLGWHMGTSPAWGRRRPCMRSSCPPVRPSQGPYPPPAHPCAGAGPAAGEVRARRRG